MTEEQKTEMTNLVKSTLKDLNVEPISDWQNKNQEITTDLNKIKEDLATLKDEITKSKCQNQDQTPDTISFV